MVVVGPAANPIATGTSVDRVDALQPQDEVVAAQPLEEVVALAPPDDAVFVIADEAAVRSWGEAAEALTPTSPDLLRPETRPYFLWWTDATVADFRRHLTSEDLPTRAYWMGALLREANTRDVWLFVEPDEIRALWPHVVRFLGRSRAMWTWLPGLPESPWPPPGASRA